MEAVAAINRVLETLQKVASVPGVPKLIEEGRRIRSKVAAGACPRHSSFTKQIFNWTQEMERVLNVQLFDDEVQILE